MGKPIPDSRLKKFDPEFQQNRILKYLGVWKNRSDNQSDVIV